MVQDPFPDAGPGDPGPDNAEPDGFPSAEDGPGSGQGLYITLPAEQLTLAGFGQGGASDTMAPGALLATVVDTVTGEDGSGLAGLSDDQLLGIISAARRLESRSAWTLMAAVGEFARRAGTGLEGEFAADELACELRMSQQSAAGQMDFATEVARRLPQTFAALAAGRIHPVHLRILEDETRILADADAAKADAVLAGAAAGMTFGELRYAAHKLILTLDPDAARKRKEAARRPAPARRTTCATWTSLWSRSPAAPATTPAPRPATGPAAPCGIWSAPAAPGAPRPGAAGPRPAAIWTIPSPGIRAASPANAVSLRYAAITISASKPRAGALSSPNRAS